MVSQQVLRFAEVRRENGSRANIWDMLTDLPVVRLHIYAPTCIYVCCEVEFCSVVSERCISLMWNKLNTGNSV